MKKLTNPWLLGTIALLLFVISMLGSSSFQECAENCKHATQYQQDSSSPFFSFIRVSLDYTRLTCVGIFIHEDRDEILAAFTVLLAFFTLALWASTSKIAEDAKEAAGNTIRTMEDTARKELRAYMAFNTILRRHHDTIWARVENYGQTPARKVSINVESMDEAPESILPYGVVPSTVAG